MAMKISTKLLGLGLSLSLLIGVITLNLQSQQNTTHIAGYYVGNAASEYGDVAGIVGGGVGGAAGAW